MRNLFVALFRFLVLCRHWVTGYFPPHGPAYAWFYGEEQPPSQESYQPFVVSSTDEPDEDDYPDGYPDDSRTAYEEECEEADQREVRWLASPDAPDDRWREDHMGDGLL